MRSKAYIIYCRIFLIAILFFGLNACQSASKSFTKQHSVKSDSSRESSLREVIITLAREMKGKSYKRGSKGPDDFDCSGLVQYIYGRMDIDMKPTAHEQAKDGTPIGFEDLKPGDLIFFGKAEKITHVGIITSYTPNNLQVVHASSSAGVIEENILKSDYWIQRMYCFTQLTSYHLDQPLSMVKLKKAK